jgi:hypothetical protein
MMDRSYREAAACVVRQTVSVAVVALSGILSLSKG